MSGFDLDRLVADLREAAVAPASHAAVKSVLEAAVEDCDAMVAGIPDYEENDVILFEDDTVSIWHSRFLPDKTVPAHDHQMLATIGVYRGAEQNTFFERAPDGRLTQTSSMELSAGQVLQIGPQAIHAVSCVSSEPCCGIHVYQGNLTEVQRSIFDMTSGEELTFTEDNYLKLTIDTD